MPTIPGEYTARINTGVLNETKISTAARPQVKPKVIIRNGIRVLVFMVLSFLDVFDRFS